MEEQKQPTGQFQIKNEKQAREERMIRRYSWKNILVVLLVLFAATVALEYYSIKEERKEHEQMEYRYKEQFEAEYGRSYTMSPHSPHQVPYIDIFFGTSRVFLFFSFLSGIVLMIISGMMYFRGMNKVAKKVFLQGAALVLVSFGIDYLIYLVQYYITSCVDCVHPMFGLWRTERY